jgi:hypothetical protein
MTLNVKAMGIACGLLWGVCVLVIGLANLAWPGYGLAFLDVVASIYPGYEVGGFGSVIWGTLYGLVDGAIAGIIVAWLYNKLAGSGA